jgi:hypothetical protein
MYVPYVHVRMYQKNAIINFWQEFAKRSRINEK